jgi:hypothetical protein
MSLPKPDPAKKPKMSQRLEDGFVFSEWYGQIAARSRVSPPNAEMF